MKYCASANVLFRNTESAPQSQVEKGCLLCVYKARKQNCRCQGDHLLGPYASGRWPVLQKLCGQPGFILALQGIHLVTSGLRSPPAAMVLSQGEPGVSLAGLFRNPPCLLYLVPPEKCLKMLARAATQASPIQRSSDPAYSQTSRPPT